MNAWLITSTFYGTWLPGDERGFVSRVRDTRRDEASSVHRHKHNIYGEQFDADLAGLREHARHLIRGPAIQINVAHAETLLTQFHETANFRQWTLHAVAIMAQHVHWVVAIPNLTDILDVLRDLKSYGSRALTEQFGKPKSETWWTSKGSTRWLPDEPALLAAIEYARNQRSPLALWLKEPSAP